MKFKSAALTCNPGGDKRRPYAGFLAVILLLAAGAPATQAQDRRHKQWWVEKYAVLDPAVNSTVARAFEIFARIKPLAETRLEREPELLVIDGGGETTVVAIDDGTIVLPLDAMDLCYRDRSLEEGDNLLAFVLGHELSHLASDEFRHLEAFFARERYVTDRRAREGLDQLDPRRASVKSESEADDRGLVLMTMAGFEPESVVEAGAGFFESWVRATPYGFSSEGGACPTPAARAAYVRAGLRLTADKLEFFDLGVRFYQMGRYEEAVSLFEEFARPFPGRAVLNNLGLSHLQAAVSALADCEAHLVRRFKLPLLLDPSSLARSVKRGTTSGCYQTPAFVRHKTKAVDYFERTIRSNPDYNPSYLNLTSLLILSNDGAGAVLWAQRCLERKPYDPEVQALSAIAIHLYDQQDASVDTDGAGLKKIRALAEQNPDSPAIAYNRARLELEVLGAPSAKASWLRFLELEPRGPYARVAREHAGLGPTAGGETKASGSKAAPRFPGPVGENLKRWLETLDRKPLRVESGRLRGKWHRGDSVGAFVVDAKIVLLERRLEKPLSQARLVRTYGSPRRVVQTTRGEFWDYGTFGFDMVNGLARTEVFFPRRRDR